jgi:hypothetical protein
LLTRTRDLIKWLFGVAATVAIVLGLAWLFEAQQPGSRAAAQKDAILRGDLNRMPASVPDGQGKGGSNLSIELENSGTTGEGVLNLKAHVEVHTDVTDLKYQWVLPEGVTMASGSPEGDLGNLMGGEAKEIEASLLVPAKENKQIHLQVYSMVNGERMGDVAQYKTVRQSEIERTLASKRELLDEQVSSGSQKPKLIH